MAIGHKQESDTSDQWMVEWSIMVRAIAILVWIFHSAIALWWWAPPVPADGITCSNLANWEVNSSEVNADPFSVRNHCTIIPKSTRENSSYCSHWPSKFHGWLNTHGIQHAGSLKHDPQRYNRPDTHGVLMNFAFGSQTICPLSSTQNNPLTCDVLGP